MSGDDAVQRKVFQNEHLRVDLDSLQVTWRVTDKSSDAIWTMAGPTDQDVTLEDDSKGRTTRSLASSDDRLVGPPRTGMPGAYVYLRDLGLGVHLFLDGPSLVVELERLHVGGPMRVRDVLFPRHFIVPQTSEAYTTWTVGQGSIVPATTPSRFHHPEGYSEQEMCFHGAFANGAGVVAIAETPFDLYVAMSHLPDEAPSAFFHWLPSMGDLRYTRRVRYTFGKGLDFVGQAKLYRAHMREQGYHVLLEEKARGNPNVAKLKGAAVVTSMTAIRRVRTMQYECNTFADQAAWATALKKKTGLERAVVHVDGWGRFGYDSVHPETLPPNAEAGGAKALAAFRKTVGEFGWLFGLHDQYIDIYADAPSYHADRLMLKENGKPNLVNMWAGGLCSHMCETESLKFVRRNYVDGVRDQYMYHNSPPIFDICSPDASYLDCFCRIHECHHPLHPLTRAETAAHQRACLRTVRERKVIQSCEHPKFWGVPDLDFAWGVGHLVADVEVSGGGHQTEPIGIPVPLWQLVFRDALWLPLHGNDYGRMFLYGCAPYFDNSKNGPGDDEIAWKLKACRLNEAIGFDEMTGFRVVDDGAAFESTFASGISVMVSPGEKTYRITGPREVATVGTVPLS